MSTHVFSLLRDARRARKEGPVGIARRQRARFAEIVAHARAHSPFYRELYRDVPAPVETPSQVPMTNKKGLMARFDDWVTDREITLEKVRAFISEPAAIGERFLDRYTALTTSGTTGVPGIFVWDDRTMAVTTVLALRMLREWLGAREVFRIIARGGRITMVCATSGHYAEAVAGARLQEKRGREKAQVLPAHAPVAELVAQLNAFGPDVLAPYASIGALLAEEQIGGRLRIKPVFIVLSAEGLPESGYDRIEKAFNVPVHHSYAATECPFISYSCDHGWLHVNSDWVLLEPVDSEYRPVSPGMLSHTVLVTNLANQVQPVVRYDLGDRLLLRPDPCECGSVLPAIRVEGRTADVLAFPTEHGQQVSIPALMFEVVDTPEVALFQIVQTRPTIVRVRLRFAPGADPERVWPAVDREIRRVLAAHGLGHVTIERAHEPPEQSAGGKYRSVISHAEYIKHGSVAEGRQS
ncbi:MAG: CoF synthetase [Acidobacteria bacterium SCN 69-37]|nr:MAG: CoF synthetase [Acidobacteria bacterium SCN 69-37]